MELVSFLHMGSVEVQTILVTTVQCFQLMDAKRDRAHREYGLTSDAAALFK